MKNTGFFFVAILLAFSSVEAKPLYVNRVTGNDATTYANNSASTPWASIGRAAWGSTNRATPNAREAAQAGDTVIVAAGTYATAGLGSMYTVAYQPANGGVPGGPITFEANGIVTLTYSASFGPLIGSNGRAHITWRGFTVDETTATIPSLAARSGATLEAAPGSTIEDCEFIGSGPESSAINHPAIFVEAGGAYSGITIRNNRIHGWKSARVHDGTGVMVYATGGMIIEHNEIYDCGTGIWLKEPSGKDVTPVRGPFDIRYNLVHDCQDFGIGIGRFEGDASNICRVYQNVVRHCHAGVRYYQSGSGANAPAYTYVVNNTIDSNAIGIHVGDMVQLANAHTKFWNNVVLNISGASGDYPAMYHYSKDGGSGGLTVLRDKAIYEAEHNLYHNYGSAFAQFGWSGSIPKSLADWTGVGQDTAVGNGKAGQSADPLFVDEASHDYRLQAGSPARNAGVDILNLQGRGTSASINAGAYVTGSEVIGPTTSSDVPSTGPAPPRPPSGVTVIR